MGEEVIELDAASREGLKSALVAQQQAEQALAQARAVLEDVASSIIVRQCYDPKTHSLKLLNLMAGHVRIEEKPASALPPPTKEKV